MKNDKWIDFCERSLFTCTFLLVFYGSIIFYANIKHKEALLENKEKNIENLFEIDIKQQEANSLGYFANK